MPPGPFVCVDFLWVFNPEDSSSRRKSPQDFSQNESPDITPTAIAYRNNCPMEASTVSPMRILSRVLSRRTRNLLFTDFSDEPCRLSAITSASPLGEHVNKQFQHHRCFHNMSEKNPIGRNATLLWILRNVTKRRSLKAFELPLETRIK